MTFAVRMFHGVATHFERRLQEWGLAGWMCVAGWIFLHANNHFQSMPAYGLLSRLVYETTWGWISLGIGASWLVALTLNGTFKPFRAFSPWVRGATSVATATYCTLNAFTSAESNPLGVNWADNACFAVLAIASSLFIGREIGRQG